MAKMYEQRKAGTGDISRRRFLSGVGATSMLPHALTASARGAEGRVAPGNRITVGIIGCGCMGRGHVRRMANSAEAQVLAVCDVDRLRVERAKVTVDQSQGHEAARGCTTHNDYRELLNREDIDAVLVVTPDHWHSPINIHAAKTGKDVYCEKPVSVTVEEGRQMVDAVQRYGRVFQNGSQYRTNPTIRRVCEFVRAGGLGRIKAVFTEWRSDPSDVYLAQDVRSPAALKACCGKCRPPICPSRSLAVTTTATGCIASAPEKSRRRTRRLGTVPRRWVT